MDLSSDTITIHLAIITILLGLSAFSSSSETAPTTVNKTHIRNLAESGSQSAVWVMKLGEDQGKVFSVMLIDNNVINLSAPSILTVLATEVFGSKAAGAVAGALTFLILISGEVTPKTIATLEAKKSALRFGHMICILMVFLTPVIAAVNWISFGVLKLLNVDPNKRGDDMTEDKLRTIAEVGYEKGVIESEEKEMINNAFDLDNSVAKDIMVPKIDMTFINMNAGLDELLEVFRQERYTRLPAYKETTDSVVGTINIKDTLLIEDRKHFPIGDHLRQPLYTFESKKLSELMMKIRGTSNNTVIVLDEYGVATGLITLKGVLEKIVGDIRDECDKDEEDEPVAPGRDRYLVGGAMKLDDLNHKLGLELAPKDYDPAGGLTTDKLEYLPTQGKEAECDGVCLVVEQVDKNHIDKIHLYLYSHSEKERD